jgi:hypothetical protein
LKLHLGVVRVASALPNPNFCPATKAHPGLLVEGLDELIDRIILLVDMLIMGSIVESSSIRGRYRQ